MIKKIGLYRFITTFCVIPTTDWAAVAQRALAWLQRLFLIHAILKLMGWVFNALKTPMFLGLIVLAITFFPDTICWIFLKIGELQMKCFLLLLNVVMPVIFETAGGEYRSWQDIWQTGLDLLPKDMLEIMNGLGVAELIGLVTSTLTSGWIIRIYRKTMERAHLM